MKNALKTLGLLLIVAAAIFVAACGPAEEPDPVVTFDANGGTFSDGTKSITLTGVKKDDVLTAAQVPTAPTKTVDQSKSDIDEGLYTAISASTCTWDPDPTNYAVTGSVTFRAKWTNTSTPENVNTNTKPDLVSKAFDIVNSATGTTKYTLLLKNNVTVNDQVVLDRPNADLTIESVGAKTITSGLVNTGSTKKTTVTGTAPNRTSDHKGVLILLGKANQTSADKISLTLSKVTLKGSETGSVNDSLIRVQYGATLELKDQAGVTGHNNSATESSGLEGNGSAVCVADKGILTVKPGAVIDNNKASGSNDNQLLVGGVYAIDEAVINMTGGFIRENHCDDTADVYATEDVIFNLSSEMNIGEITINVENSKNTTIKLSGLTKTIDRLNLRATGKTTIADVRSAWVPNKVILASQETGTAITGDDVDKVILGEFRGSKPTTGTAPKANITDTHKISNTGTNIGILVTK